MTWRHAPIVLLVLMGVGFGCSGKSKHGGGNNPLPPLSMTITPANVPADGATTASITLTARDKSSGNPIQGQIITLTASGTGNVLAQPAPTDSNGITEGRISSTVAETKVITATSSTGDVASASVTFVTAPNASNATMSLISGNNQTAAPNAVLPEVLVVRVLDPSGAPVVNVPVVFTVTSGGGILSITNTTTSETGTARTTMRLGPTVGDNTVTVIATGPSGGQVNGSPVVFHETAQ